MKKQTEEQQAQTANKDFWNFPLLMDSVPATSEHVAVLILAFPLLL